MDPRHRSCREESREEEAEEGNSRTQTSMEAVEEGMDRGRLEDEAAVDEDEDHRERGSRLDDQMSEAEKHCSRLSNEEELQVLCPLPLKWRRPGTKLPPGRHSRERPKHSPPIPVTLSPPSQSL